MRPVLLLLSLMALLSWANAQSIDAYVGLTVGPSIPISDFGSKDTDNEEARFAQTGFGINIPVRHQIGKGNFGFAGSLRYQNIPYASERLTDAANEAIGFDNFWVRLDDWHLLGLMAGGYGGVRLTDHWQWNATVQAGWLWHLSPGMIVDLGGPTGPASYYAIDRELGRRIAFCLGTEMKFDLSDRLALLVQGQLLLMNADGPDTRATRIASGDAFIRREQMIRSVSTSLGLIYRL